MEDPENTQPRDLLRALSIGRDAGLKYIYAGNLPGMVGDEENTRCHSCGETLIRRRSFLVRDYRISAEGRCPACNTEIPGRWAAKFDGQIAERPFLPRRGSGLVTIHN